MHVCVGAALLSFRGKHMVPVLNAINPHVGCYGNHDFDFGVEQMEKLSAQCLMPWVMTNLVDSRTGLPVAGAKKSEVITKNGVVLGILGLAEEVCTAPPPPLL